MKRGPILLSLAALTFATAATAAPVTFEVDPAHSSASFSIRHLVARVPGQFNEIAGSLVYDAENPAGSSFQITVQAASIDTRNEKRDGHLRSPDFFDVEKFPTLSFKSTTVGGGGETLQVTGDLTIHGVTQRLTVPVKVLGVADTPMGTRAGFSATFTINRKDFGIVWNKALDAGGTLLGEEVEITVDVEAVKG